VQARLSRHKILLASLGVRRETIMPISVVVRGETWNCEWHAWTH